MKKTPYRIDLTHKGWFGLCPVYFGNLHAEGPFVVERHWTLWPLMVISELLLRLVIMVHVIFKRDADELWPMLVTGKIAPGRYVTIETREGWDG